VLDLLCTVALPCIPVAFFVSIGGGGAAPKSGHPRIFTFLVCISAAAAFSEAASLEQILILRSVVL